MKFNLKRAYLVRGGGGWVALRKRGCGGKSRATERSGARVARALPGAADRGRSGGVEALRGSETRVGVLIADLI